MRAPGDKSISHRALILGGLAQGETLIEGLLEGEDVLRTAAAVRAFGAAVEPLGAGNSWRVVGRGRFHQPRAVIDCGNAGTGARLLMGAAAGFPIEVRFDGDASLRSRPMSRVIAPLQAMGARFAASEGGRLPLTLNGGSLKGLSYRLPVPSAQVKSAILLAGLNARGPTEVIEPEPSRDHTERMLRAFGGQVQVEDAGSARVITLRPGGLTGHSLRVPGDPSSAAFPLVAGLIVEGSDVTVETLLLNPLRTGLFQTLMDMGADLTIDENPQGAGGPGAGERTGRVRVRAGRLKGIVVSPERAPSMIDEYPILAVAAAFAEGPTVMRGIGELRVKESDRIALMAGALSACGVEVEEEPDALIVHGRGSRPAGGGDIRTGGDHRVAMSALVLGLGARAAVSVDEPGMIATSFPGFEALMRGLGADIGPA